MYKVDRFDFESKELADLAIKEKNGIKYIKTNSDMSDPQNALMIYNKLNKKGMFKTPIGFSFLLELQECLYAMPEIDNSDIDEIHISAWAILGKKANGNRMSNNQNNDVSQKIILENKKLKLRL